MIEIILANGATLRMSAGHPTADGRRFGDVRAGETIDGVTVASSREIAYLESYTYDILPDSDSHTYIAAGVLVGTTLSESLSPSRCSSVEGLAERTSEIKGFGDSARSETASGTASAP